MDNVHAHYVRNNTPVKRRGENDSWLLYDDHAIFVFNNITGEYDFLGYDKALRTEEPTCSV